MQVKILGHLGKQSELYFASLLTNTSSLDFKCPWLPGIRQLDMNFVFVIERSCLAQHTQAMTFQAPFQKCFIYQSKLKLYGLLSYSQRHGLAGLDWIQTEFSNYTYQIWSSRWWKLHYYKFFLPLVCIPADGLTQRSQGRIILKNSGI